MIENFISKGSDLSLPLPVGHMILTETLPMALPAA